MRVWSIFVGWKERVYGWEKLKIYAGEGIFDRIGFKIGWGLWILRV